MRSGASTALQCHGDLHAALARGHRGHLTLDAEGGHALDGALVAHRDLFFRPAIHLDLRDESDVSPPVMNQGNLLAHEERCAVLPFVCALLSCHLLFSFRPRSVAFLNGFTGKSLRTCAG